MTDVHEFLPLTPPVFHILVALARGERHGYAVMKEVEEATGGQLRLGPGKLYYSIQRMLDKGLIVEVASDDVDDDPRRRYYRVSELGRAVVLGEAKRLRDAVELARVAEILETQGTSS